MFDREATANEFPTKIPLDDAHNLKSFIKTKKAPRFDGIATDEQTLWYVSLPFIPAKHSPIVLSEIDSTTELDLADDLSDVFEEQPAQEDNSHNRPATSSGNADAFCLRHLALYILILIRFP